MKQASIKNNLETLISDSLKKFFLESEIPDVVLEIPGNKKFGDLSCNIALKSAKILKELPLGLAEKFKIAIAQGLEGHSLKQKIKSIEVVNPGFVNFYLSDDAIFVTLENILAQQEEFGRSDTGKGRKIQIEFVSANPTGPLSVAHARQAVVGDSLANVLRFVGYDVTKEYYVNDEGNQINILGLSIKVRALECLGETIEFPQDGYQGDYIVDIAKDFMKDHNVTTKDELCDKELVDFSQYGVNYLLNIIKNELNEFGVYFDNWAHQSEIATEENIEKLLEDFKNKKYFYEKDSALWFKTTDYGDDKDRVVKKSDGAYTYFTPDIVYHKNKFDRGFQEVVNIWGPDHHGYIPRMQAAVEALGQDRQALRVLIVQLATIYRDGQPIQMSTRRGQYISLREVMDEVGVDVARYFFLMRNIKAHLDFDLELAKKQTSENPVYYIQYAHARIHSIISKALEEKIILKKSGFILLTEEEEKDLIKKLSGFSLVLVHCSQQMDVFALVNYLLELAICFHKFYDHHRVLDIENPDLSSERLSLIDATRIVISNGLKLLGISQPERM